MSGLGLRGRLTGREANGAYFAVFAFLTAIGAGFVATRSEKLAIVVALAVVVSMFVVIRPVSMALIAVVGVFVVQRVGGASFAAGGRSGVSYSDVLLAAASLMAIPAILRTPQLQRLKVPLIGVASYLVCLLPTLIANQSRHADTEWLHRLVLVGGALVVGAWIAREGRERAALRLLVFVAVVVAVLAIEKAASTGFAPATPLGMNKNFVGQQLAACLVILLVTRPHLELRMTAWVAAVLVVGGGLVASQSRGAIIGAGVGLLVTFRAHGKGVKVLAAILSIALGVFTYTSIHKELNQTQDAVNNSSIGVRQNVERVTRDIWRTSPVVGVGLKYFNTGHYGPFAQPANNDVDNELAESGVIGLVGFVAMQGAVLAAGFRRRKELPLIAAGVGVVAGELMHGMVDIYWTAGTVALPFLVIGMGLARSPGEGSEPPGRRVEDETAQGTSAAVSPVHVSRSALLPGAG